MGKAAGTAAVSVLPSSLLVQQAYAEPASNNAPEMAGIMENIPQPEILLTQRYALDLSPARWIWFPAARVLANSFYFFRRSLDSSKKISSVKGWLLGDSRYVLYCNGKRVQFGPAPSDPRYAEADPVDLGPYLQEGENVIGVLAMYYGYGDGTWPTGKAGFICRLDVSYADGSSEIIGSDSQWKTRVANSWKPGMYKRWYLRSLQEIFDNREYPENWHSPGYVPDGAWQPARELLGAANATALSTNMSDYMYDSGAPAVTQMRKRMIPLLREYNVTAKGLAEYHWLQWDKDVLEYFDMITDDAYKSVDINAAIQADGEYWKGSVPGGDKGLVMTFEFDEHIVGFPYFSIEAPEGTMVELMVQQGHVPFGQGGPPLINQNFHSWSRFICKAGQNDFMAFDYESLRWIQLHIHGRAGEVKVGRVGVLRRVYDYPEQPMLSTSDHKLQKLFNASFNTVLNQSQDIVVDCMGRERQQYSGDIGHALHMIHRAFGDDLLPARYTNTYSHGLTIDGFFMDSWPAFDRLNRLGQRQLDMSKWGSIIDHGVGFNYDCWYHYLYAGKKEDLEEVFPRLARFYKFLHSVKGEDGLLKVEDLGLTVVWMDHEGYKQQKHKICSFNLYVAAMLQDAFAPLCGAFGESALGRHALDFSAQLVAEVKKQFWSAEDRMLYVNLPWHKEEGELRTCERSISHYILSGFAEEADLPSLGKELSDRPERHGRSYPANAQWGYWALAACGRIQAVLDDFRKLWYPMPSVQYNNAMQENWIATPDRTSQYSHVSVSPIYIAYMSIAGIKVMEPGAGKVQIRPQAGDLEDFSIRNYTAKGAIGLSFSGKPGRRTWEIQVPDGVEADLILDEREKPNLPTSDVKAPAGMKAWKLQAGKTWKQRLRYS